MTAPEVRTPGGNRADAQQETTDRPIVPEAERKRFETMRAAAALSGVQVYRLGDGSYLLTRWNMHRELPDLDAVAGLLRRMGV